MKAVRLYRIVDCDGERWVVTDRKLNGKEEVDVTLLANVYEPSILSELSRKRELLPLFGPSSDVLTSMIVIRSLKKKRKTRSDKGSKKGTQ